MIIKLLLFVVLFIALYSLIMTIQIIIKTYEDKDPHFMDLIGLPIYILVGWMLTIKELIKSIIKRGHK